MSKAAKDLNINHNILYRKLKQFDILISLDSFGKLQYHHLPWSQVQVYV